MRRGMRVTTRRMYRDTWKDHSSHGSGREPIKSVNALPRHLSVFSACSIYWSLKDHRAPNQSFKIPERIFLPYAMPFPEPRQFDSHPSLRLLYYDFYSRNTGHRGWASLIVLSMLGENPKSASVAFAMTAYW